MYKSYQVSLAFICSQEFNHLTFGFRSFEDSKFKCSPIWIGEISFTAKEIEYYLISVANWCIKLIFYAFT